MTIAPAETDREISLESMPDFDEIIACQCLCHEQDGQQPPEATHRARFEPCLCVVMLCHGCVENLYSALMAISAMPNTSPMCTICNTACTQIRVHPL